MSAPIPKFDFEKVGTTRRGCHNSYRQVCLAVKRFTDPGNLPIIAAPGQLDRCASRLSQNRVVMESYGIWTY